MIGCRHEDWLVEPPVDDDDQALLDVEAREHGFATGDEYLDYMRGEIEAACESFREVETIAPTGGVL